MASAWASSADGLVQVQLRGGLLRGEDFLALEILALEGDVGLGAGQFALGLAQLRPRRRVGSISATSCPFFTGELKSTDIAEILPETWLPTSTLTTALKVPLAVTCWTRSPRAAVAVSYLEIAPAGRFAAGDEQDSCQKSRNDGDFHDSSRRSNCGRPGSGVPSRRPNTLGGCFGRAFEDSAHDHVEDRNQKDGQDGGGEHTPNHAGADGVLTG